MPSGIKEAMKKARADEQNSADFFNFVVTLSKDVYRVFDFLSDNGIAPSDSKTHDFQDIHNAMEKSFGKGEVTKFKINCMKDEEGNTYLNDVMLCIDKDYNPIDCKFHTGTSCPETGILYPTKKSRKSLAKKELALF